MTPTRRADHIADARNMVGVDRRPSLGQAQGTGSLTNMEHVC